MFACWTEEGKKGALGARQGTKNGAVDSGHRASKGESSLLHTKTIPSTRVSFYIYIHHTCY
jgi:hypothetical protein